MPEGGFLIKFDGKKKVRCYSVAVHFDEWECVVNDKKKIKLPEQLKAITIKVERDPLGLVKPDL